MKHDIIKYFSEWTFLPVQNGILFYMLGTWKRLLCFEISFQKLPVFETYTSPPWWYNEKSLLPLVLVRPINEIFMSLCGVWRKRESYMLTLVIQKVIKRCGRCKSVLIRKYDRISSKICIIFLVLFRKTRKWRNIKEYIYRWNVKVICVKWLYLKRIAIYWSLYHLNIIIWSYLVRFKSVTDYLLILKC